MTDRESAMLQRAIEKAAVRSSLKSQHPISCEELLELRVQILTTSKRLVFGFVAIVFACIAWALNDLDLPLFALFSALISIGGLFFAIIGVRRTVSLALETLDSSIRNKMLECALQAAVDVVASALD
jgi:hypothetical protein